MPALRLLNMTLVLKVLAVFIEEDNNVQNSSICNSPKCEIIEKSRLLVEEGDLDSRQVGRQAREGRSVVGGFFLEQWFPSNKDWLPQGPCGLVWRQLWLLQLERCYW